MHMCTQYLYACNHYTEQRTAPRYLRYSLIVLSRRQDYPPSIGKKAEARARQHDALMDRFTAEGNHTLLQIHKPKKANR